MIDIIRNEFKTNKLIEVYHNDQESNDFTEMFNYINKSNDSYLKRYKNIYSYGKGSSLIYQILPNESCDIICSFYTFQWADLNILNSKKQIELFKLYLKDHIFICKESIPTFYDFTYNHLNNILTLRYNELRIGGNLICNLLCFEKDETELAYKSIKLIFRDMANEGLLTHNEVDNMFGTFLSYRKEIINNVLDEWNLKGFKVTAKSNVLIDWRELSKDSIAKFKNIDRSKVTDDEYISYFVESTLGYCGPPMRNAIKGNEEKVNELYNLFKSRFLQKVKQDNNYNLVFSSLFLVLTKVK